MYLNLNMKISNKDKFNTNFEKYRSIDSVRNKATKSRNQIKNYKNFVRNCILVEIPFEHDLIYTEMKNIEYLWFEVEAFLEDILLVRLIQHPRFISYLVEGSLYEFEINAISNWKVFDEED